MSYKNMEEQKTLSEEFIEGSMLLVDKPLKWTSFDVVNKIKSLLRYTRGIKKIKIGHAGTLDPLATGLLIICTGKMTKAIERYQQQAKEYTGTFFLGATTPSSDLETEPDVFFPTEHITKTLLQDKAKKFQGEISQVPPLFSAKKILGERAYEHARKGIQTTLKPNKICIHEFEILQVEMPVMHFKVNCSKGTYIRALARDFGQAINSGAYLKSLRRTRIGDFHVDNAWKIEELSEILKNSKPQTG